MLAHVEAELERVKARDLGGGRLSVSRECTNVVRLTDGQVTLVVWVLRLFVALRHVRPEDGVAVKLIALQAARLERPVQCDGCGLLYEHGDGTDSREGARYCLGCCAREDVVLF